MQLDLLLFNLRNILLPQLTLNTHQQHTQEQKTTNKITYLSYTLHIDLFKVHFDGNLADKTHELRGLDKS